MPVSGLQFPHLESGRMLTPGCQPHGEAVRFKGEGKSPTLLQRRGVGGNSTATVMEVWR